MDLPVFLPILLQAIVGGVVTIGTADDIPNMHAASVNAHGILLAGKIEDSVISAEVTDTGKQYLMRPKAVNKVNDVKSMHATAVTSPQDEIEEPAVLSAESSDTGSKHLMRHKGNAVATLDKSLQEEREREKLPNTCPFGLVKPTQCPTKYLWKKHPCDGCREENHEENGWKPIVDCPNVSDLELLKPGDFCKVSVGSSCDRRRKRRTCSTFQTIKDKANIGIQKLPGKKILCIGDSITRGTKDEDQRMVSPSYLEDPLSPTHGPFSYPGQLQMQLNKWQNNKFEVVNLGHGGRTAMKDTDYPYTATREYARIKEKMYDYVIIMLGTNDAKVIDSQSYKNTTYEEDYGNFIDSVMGLENLKGAKFALGLPIPYLCEFKVDIDRLKSEQPEEGIFECVSKDETHPNYVDKKKLGPHQRYCCGRDFPEPANFGWMRDTVKQIARDKKLKVIDFYEPFIDLGVASLSSLYTQTDPIHFRDDGKDKGKGFRMMGEVALNLIKDWEGGDSLTPAPRTMPAPRTTSAPRTTPAWPRTTPAPAPRTTSAPRATPAPRTMPAPRTTAAPAESPRRKGKGKGR